MRNLKICAAIMVHNMEETIRACIHSVNWADAIYLFDDYSEDRSVGLARRSCKTKLIIKESSFPDIAFKYGESKVRNTVIKNAFAKSGADAVILLDADEMMADIVKPAIVSAFSTEQFDSIALNIWHLFDRTHYLHIWETIMNGIPMVDPHVRIIKKGKFFQDRFSDGSHPYMKVTSRTICLNGAYHYHLKYFHALKLPNYSLDFLPVHPKRSEMLPYLRQLGFTLPEGIREGIGLTTKAKNSDSIAHYEGARVVLSTPKEALIHPRDRRK